MRLAPCLALCWSQCPTWRSCSRRSRPRTWRKSCGNVWVACQQTIDGRFLNAWGGRRGSDLEAVVPGSVWYLRLTSSSSNDDILIPADAAMAIVLRFALKKVPRLQELKEMMCNTKHPSCLSAQRTFCVTSTCLLCSQTPRLRVRCRRQ